MKACRADRVFSLIAEPTREAALGTAGLLLLLLAGCGSGTPEMSALDSQCVDCHKDVTPRLVTDWKLSRHREEGVDCTECHGEEHTTAADVAEVGVATPDVCATCHPVQVEQFTAGKHALAWISMNAMPTTHWLPMELTEGMKGCGGCHRLGLKNEEEIETLKAQGDAFGLASCDVCHTRHLFSVKEASAPQACRTCHMGIDHPQWEMYSSSKHGVRHLLKQTNTLPENAAAPTCQNCHMPKGNHEVRTAWGFLAVRLPLPEDPQWKQDQVTILKALGVLDPEGNPTERLEVVKKLDVARLTQEAWEKERNRMIAICSDCHSENFVKGELRKGDEMIRQVDRLLAEAIQIVAGLYRDGLLRKPGGYAYAYPDLLAFHDAPTVIEQRLFKMHT